MTNDQIKSIFMEILRSCDAVRDNPDWFEAIMLAYSKMPSNDYVLNRDTITWTNPAKASTTYEYGGRGGGPDVLCHGGGGGNWRDW